ncbi:MAG TPA: hypothetical protein VEU96_19565 [Bryobacteraceae bacterium]|nr:hypothetical protein [Bryobacteraceae bacterium]
MKRRLTVSLCRLIFAVAIVFAAIAPKNLHAITCTWAILDGQFCTQCFVWSPLGWIAVSDPTWGIILPASD